MYSLPERRYRLPLTPDEQQEVLGELMSARARNVKFREEVQTLWLKLQLLEKCREELTSMIQELNVEVTRLSRKKK